MGRCLESGHKHTHETYGGEVLNVAHPLLITCQWNGELIPCRHLRLTIARMHISNLLIGDEVFTHQHRVGMNSNVILEVTLVLVQGVILVDVLDIGRRS